MDKNRVTRRHLLQGGLALAAGAMLPHRLHALIDTTSKSRVVLIRDLRMLDGGDNPVASAVQDALDAAVCALVDKKDPLAAWKQLVTPKDIVGIKSNRGQRLETTSAVEQAILRRVRDVGVKPEAVAIDDQGVLDNPVFKNASALINARPIRTHHWAGLGTCLKNYIMFDPTPSKYHPNTCESLGAAWHLPIVKGKTRLNIQVLFTPLFHSVGPHGFNKAFTWSYAGLVVGHDPVAVDTVAASIIAAQRKLHFGEDRPISPPPHHITFADTRYGVGTSRMERIDLVRLGETKGMLI